MISSRKKSGKQKKATSKKISDGIQTKITRSIKKMLLPIDTDPFRVIVNYKGIEGQNCLYYKKRDHVPVDFPDIDIITSICPFPNRNLMKFLENANVKIRKPENFGSIGREQNPLSADDFHTVFQRIVKTSEQFKRWEPNIKEAYVELLVVQNSKLTKAELLKLEITKFFAQFSPARWKPELPSEMTLPVPISMNEEKLTVIPLSRVQKIQNTSKFRYQVGEQKSGDSLRSQRKRKGQEEIVSQPEKRRREDCIVLPIEFEDNDKVTYLRLKPINGNRMGVVLLDLWRLVSLEGQAKRKALIKALDSKIIIENVILERGRWERKSKTNTQAYEIISIESALALLDRLSKSPLEKFSKNIEKLRQVLSASNIPSQPIILPNCVDVNNCIYKEQRTAIEIPAKSVGSEPSPSPMDSESSSSAASGHFASTAAFSSSTEAKREDEQPVFVTDATPDGDMNIDYSAEGSTSGILRQLGIPLKALAGQEEEKDDDYDVRNFLPLELNTWPHDSGISSSMASFSEPSDLVENPKPAPGMRLSFDPLDND